MSEWHYSHTEHEGYCVREIFKKTQFTKGAGMKSLPLTNIIALNRAWIFLKVSMDCSRRTWDCFWRSNYTCEVFISTIIFWDKVSRTGENAECIGAVSVPWEGHDTVVHLCLSSCSLKNSPSPTVVPGAAALQENTVVGREVQETSGPSKQPFPSTVWLAFISRRKQSLREKS